MSSSLDSTYLQVLTKLGTLENVLGTEIKEFMNVFKIIHGFQGTDSEDGTVSDKVEATGMISKEVIQIYEEFLTLQTAEEKIEDFEFFVEGYTSTYLPVMPKIVYMTNFKENGLTDYRSIELLPMEKVGDRLKVNARVSSGESGSEFSLKTYKDSVRAELGKFVSSKVFKYFAGAVKDLDEINNSNATSFSKEFKALKIYSDEKSFFDYLMAFSVNPDIKEDVRKSLTTDDKNSVELLDIAELFDLYKHTKRPDAMNSLVVDIMEKQRQIDSTKETVGTLRKRLYTFISRDKNYTHVLKNGRRGLYITITLFVILVVIFTGLLFVKNVPEATKAIAIAAISSLILSLHLIKQLFGIIMGNNKQIKENFVNDAELGFQMETTNVEGEDETTAKSCNRVLALAHFIDKFSEVLSTEIKQEYFDALSDSQVKDMDMLKQLEKEHSVSGHFHQLKNNLTHYKINETMEYKRMAWNGILLTCVLGLLIAIKLQNNMSARLFKMIAGTLGVSYITYCLISYKALMLRDRQDWDRFHWVVNKIESQASDSCNGLSGFARK